MDALRYTTRFRASRRLEDGSRVSLRLLRPGDKPKLQSGLSRLSPESRYRRFHAHRDHFSESELAYLTELDGWNHVALCAIVRGEGVGVARFIRLADDPTSADAAIVIDDAHQGKGLGKILLGHLAAAARERGVASFRCDVLVDNQPMRALLRRLSPEAHERVEGDGLLEVEVPLA